jgi:hypothetical protein
MGVEQLRRGRHYVIRKPFTDYYSNAFTPGEVLTYVERHFLPYEGGHTLVFQERMMYLQEDAQTEILDALENYLLDVG